MIDLLDNLIPSTLDIYALLFRSGSFDEYFETLFRVWTFVLRWNRKNYNKAPLAFISDYYYWKDNGHPFSKVIRSNIVNFNDYYVENVHSRIRANTTSLHSAEAIIKEAYLLDLHDQSTINTFKKVHSYPYSEPILEYLTTKTSLFLLEHFHSIYNNINQENQVQGSRRKAYKLATLNKNVELKCLPAGYHTSFPPDPKLCDRCKRPFENDEGIVLICGHRYHLNCYNILEERCKYCEDYYERGIFANVDSFVERLEKGPNILSSEDVEEGGEEVEEAEDSNNINVETELNIYLDRELDLVKYW